MSVNLTPAKHQVELRPDQIETLRQLIGRELRRIEELPDRNDPETGGPWIRRQQLLAEVVQALNRPTS